MAAQRRERGQLRGRVASLKDPERQKWGLLDKLVYIVRSARAPEDARSAPVPTPPTPLHPTPSAQSMANVRIHGILVPFPRLCRGKCPKLHILRIFCVSVSGHIKIRRRSKRASPAFRLFAFFVCLDQLAGEFLFGIEASQLSFFAYRYHFHGSSNDKLEFNNTHTYLFSVYWAFASAVAVETVVHVCRTTNYCIYGSSAPLYRV